MLREVPLEENRKRELSSALHVFFKDWLYGNASDGKLSIWCYMQLNMRCISHAS